VYQAYRPSIGQFAAENGFFGGGFRLRRMSWIKPSFLWMMWRSCWGQKPRQEVVLAVWIKRSAFDLILSKAVHSSFQAALYPDKEAWKKAVARSDVRLQWDPDHDPSGGPMRRRAIQLGLRGSVLALYARQWSMQIEDITDFVRSQHKHALSGNYSALTTPSEEVYPVTSLAARRRLQLSGQYGL
jgi:hypothetical protein